MHPTTPPDTLAAKDRSERAHSGIVWAWTITVILSLLSAVTAAGLGLFAGDPYRGWASGLVISAGCLIALSAVIFGLRLRFYETTEERTAIVLMVVLHFIAAVVAVVIAIRIS